MSVQRLSYKLDEVLRLPKSFIQTNWSLNSCHLGDILFYSRPPLLHSCSSYCVPVSHYNGRNLMLDTVTNYKESQDNTSCKSQWWLCLKLSTSDLKFKQTNILWEWEEVIDDILSTPLLTGVHRPVSCRIILMKCICGSWLQSVSLYYCPLIAVIAAPVHGLRRVSDKKV